MSDQRIESPGKLAGRPLEEWNAAYAKVTEAKSVADAILRRVELLESDQCDTIDSWASDPEADPQLIAKEIVNRGWLSVFQVKSFSTVKIPVYIVNLGKPGEIPQTALASGIAKAIPKSTYSTIEDASHYSMFGECKPGAPELAVSEEVGDPICSDRPARGMSISSSICSAPRTA